MLFSILVANFNNGHFFKDCYNSMLEQTYGNWEVIIVDDGSTDGSVRQITELINGDQRFELYCNRENRGCGYTKNRCAELAKGEILGFLDPDDALHPEALETMVRCHSKYEGAAVVTSKYELVDLEMNFVSVGIHGSEIPVNKSYLTYGKGALTAFATFKRKHYIKTTGIDILMRRAVDQDLYYKLEEQGEHVFIDKVLYRYRIHKNSISHNENLFKAQYWHFYAMQKAYKRRRLEKKDIDNFPKAEMKELTSDYYLGRMEKVKFTGKLKAKYYFLFKAIVAKPIHKLERKLKSLVLITLGRI